MSEHTCHARGCTAPVPPKFLMCRKHWRMVPPALQRAVNNAYRLGQEITKEPTAEWMRAAEAAIDFVAAKEALSPDATMFGARDTRVGHELAAVLAPEPTP